MPLTKIVTELLDTLPPETIREDLWDMLFLCSLKCDCPERKESILFTIKSLIDLTHKMDVVNADKEKVAA